MKLHLFPLLLGCAACVASTGAAAQPGLTFSTSGGKEFTFDTGVLRGKIRAGGRSAGLSSVIHIPTNTRLDASMGLFGYYRVFTTNKRYGNAAWDWPSDASLAADGSLQVRWPAAEGRPFKLTAQYRWSAPDCLDLETTVQADADLPGFEVFLASYWASLFTNSLVYVGELPNQPGMAGFLPATREAGVWQVFPRDQQVVPLIRDGRWKIEPNPVDWVVMPSLARPLGVRRAPTAGLAGLMMSPPADCFAIFTPHEEEPHYSMYLSLFGRDIKMGETARARARLIIRKTPSDQEVLAASEGYRKETSAK